MKKPNLQLNGLYLIVCPTCGQEALKKSSKARFCSPRCRYAYHYEMQRRIFPVEYMFFDGLLNNARIVLSLKGDPVKKYSKKDFEMLKFDFNCLPLPKLEKGGKTVFTFSGGRLIWDDSTKYFNIE